MPKSTKSDLSRAARELARQIADGSLTLAQFDEVRAAVAAWSQRFPDEANALASRLPAATALHLNGVRLSRKAASTTAPAAPSRKSATTFEALPPIDDEPLPQEQPKGRRMKRSTIAERQFASWAERQFGVLGADAVEVATAAGAEFDELKSRGPSHHLTASKETHVGLAVERWRKQHDAEVVAERDADNGTAKN